MQTPLVYIKLKNINFISLKKYLEDKLKNIWDYRNKSKNKGYIEDLISHQCTIPLEQFLIQENQHQDIS